jgi:hypothetical protein
MPSPRRPARRGVIIAAMTAGDREALRRLGGGRWETRDGRFTIEPESGTWVLVDTSATNELGLPLVRGPYPSLAEARAAIDEARRSGAPESPLAEALERARAAGDREASTEGRGAGGREGGRRGKGGRDAVDAAPAPPEPPPEPAWLRALDPAEAKRARTLPRRLASVGVDDPDRLVRDELTGPFPAVTSVALGRRLAEIGATAADPADAVRQAADLLLHGRDRELGVGWRLVADDGREVGRIDLGGPKAAPPGGPGPRARPRRA